jgi:hypothetical protein
VARAACDPTSRNYWQAVAKQVPGKSAQQCYDKVSDIAADPCLDACMLTGAAGLQGLAHVPHGCQ